MEYTFLYTTLFLLFLVLVLKLFQSKTSQKNNLPPTPPSLPILGHLRMIKPPLHRVFHKLSQQYGPIMSLKFGFDRAVIISSAPAVEECFTKNDIVLANRPQLLAGKHLTYNYNTIASIPYGDHWRNIRRVGAIEVFSTHRLNSFLSIRKDEVRHLLRRLSCVSQQGFAKVELKSMLTDVTFNVIMRMAAGKRYYGDGVAEKEEAREFKDLIAETLRYAGASNTEDFLPVLNWVTLGSFERKLKRIAERRDRFLQRLIDEHRSNKRDGLESMNTTIGHLLHLQEIDPNYYTDEMIKAFIVTMLIAGTDTSAVTLEWAMSNLLNNPDVMEKAKMEMDSQVGQEHLMEESNISKLPYLHNIISETLRLCPPAPLLLPHMSSNNCTIGGYDVPRNTIILINAWAIHRDPALWDDPTSFMPERFENREGDVGHKLMPFGLGRRACPGAGLAQRVVGLTLGSLIQCFEWKRVDEKLVDMTEGKGLTMPKAEPLLAMCKARGILDTVSF